MEGVILEDTGWTLNPNDANKKKRTFEEINANNNIQVINDSGWVKPKEVK